ncbi:hypothetical protein [Flavobacterium sp.]|uniref:hypothetical protein n=1 Tax=Flavobacterium sp. TaxID=239 RepID=UPI0038FCF9F6
MKNLKLVLAFIVLFSVTGCITTVPISQEFYKGTKVGVIIQMNNDPSVIRAQTNGITRIITESDNKFHIGLSEIKSNFNFKESLKKEISNTLSSKNKSFEIISENFNDASLTKFEAPNLEIEYPELDFRFMKGKYNVDEILFIKVHNYGLLLIYSGVLLATKKGHTLIDTQIIDLKDNSLLQQKRFETNTKIKGSWKGEGDYKNLQTSIQKTIDKSVLKIKQKLQ